MDADIDHPPAAQRNRSSRIEELDCVRLTRDLAAAEGAFDKGSTGTIVHVHGGGLAYEVEITHPVHAVVTVDAADVERLTV